MTVLLRQRYYVCLEILKSLDDVSCQRKYAGTGMDDSKLNWGENMLGHHCNGPNVDGMPSVEMRIQATMVQQGADVCAEADA